MGVLLRALRALLVRRVVAEGADAPVHSSLLSCISRALQELAGYSLDPPLREPDIKRTDLAQPPGGLRDGRFQVETAHLPLQNVIFALFRGPGWLREQSTSESSVLLMVGRNCTMLIL